jgi:hypothetical protein
MIHFILLIIITVFWIWGVKVLFKKGEILGAQGEWMRSKWPKWVVKPLFSCPSCMSSVHNTLIYFMGLHFNQLPILISSNWLLFWPFFCTCTAGINHILIEHLYDTSE